MKILCSADWHINLNKKKVPKAWQINRFNMFFQKLYELEEECDIHIIAGDIFDSAPDLEETCLFNGFLNSISIPTFIIPGNHEATKKGESFLGNYMKHNAIHSTKINIFTKNTRIDFKGQGFQFFPYGEMQINRLPSYIDGDILITHIRGEVPPHINPEYDFEKIRKWKLILLGDLHFNHQYQDYPAYYPGSPVNVSFDRDDTRFYGVNIVDFRSIDDYEVHIIDLKLPKLIRKTIEVGEAMTKHDYDHVVYEVVGSIDELAKVDNNELLDKKIAHKPQESSKLDLSEKATLLDELEAYLKYIKVSNIKDVMDEFVDLKVS